MRSVKLTKAVSCGTAGALVPALGLAAGIADGFIIGFSGAAAIMVCMLIMRLAPSEKTSGAGPVAAVAVPGFISGILWVFVFREAGIEYAAAYLAAFALCIGGVAYGSVLNGRKKAGFQDAASAATGFFAVCFLLGSARQFIILTPGQSLFIAGIILFILKSAIKEKVAASIAA